MSSKNVTHDSRVKSHQTAHDTRIVFIVAAILFVIGFVVVLVGLQSRNITIAADNSSEAVAYTNALALQYAYPYLEADKGVTIEFGDALAMEHAQPWLDKQQFGNGSIEDAKKSVWVTIARDGSSNAYSSYTEPYWKRAAESDNRNTGTSDVNASLYAYPLLDKQTVEAASAPAYSDALTSEVPRPYLDAQKDAAAPSSNDLAMEDATLWLRIKQFVIYNGRIIKINVRPLK